MLIRHRVFFALGGRPRRRRHIHDARCERQLPCGEVVFRKKHRFLFPLFRFWKEGARAAKGRKICFLTCGKLFGLWKTLWKLCKTQ